MKKRIRKTGEVVDVIAYSSCHTRMNDDYVSYIDSKGEENHAVRGLNYYWDFEDVEEELHTDIDWEKRRYEIAKDIMANIYDLSKEDMYAHMAVLAADALISELGKGDSTHDNPKLAVCRCCGSCVYFENEDAFGEGYCIVNNELKHCSSDACEKWKMNKEGREE